MNQSLKFARARKVSYINEKARARNEDQFTLLPHEDMDTR